jgi:NAD(P)-dependent dehydrogenase (short-subunit alcohol dehydrogenase family)
MAVAGVTIDLGGRVALVTGAGAGIGQAIAARLARAGARVGVNDVDGERALATCAAIVDSGGEAVPFVADVTAESDVVHLVDAVAGTFGGLDIAVNNVGMMGGLAPRPSLELDATYIRTIVDLNLTSALICSVAEARAMVSSARGGVIVNVSSGETTRAAPGLVPYGAAKAAVNHLSRSLAVELGPHGIRVNAVAPGTTPTEHVRAAMSADHLEAIGRATPIGRLCEPDDLADLVLFVVSDLAAAVTGQLLLADGGAHASLTRPPSAPGGMGGSSSTLVEP